MRPLDYNAIHHCRCIKKSTRHNLGGNLFIGHRGCILLTPCVHRVGSYRQWVLGQPSCAMYCVHIPIPIATAKAWCCAFFTAINNLIHQHLLWVEDRIQILFPRTVRGHKLAKYAVPLIELDILALEIRSLLVCLERNTMGEVVLANCRTRVLENRQATDIKGKIKQKWWQMEVLFHHIISIYSRSASHK